MNFLSSLTREQKQSIGLLQMGTFLEYFDLMLYVHMAVLLNELFFPKTDPKTAAFLSAFALCSSLAFRPLGALFFGWLGDHLGRKTTIIVSTSMMAISCVVMANLPPYAQIGIAASWLVTICRIVQGISSMGEAVGAQIYLTETIERPTMFPSVAFVGLSADMGTLFALGVAYTVTNFNINWRYAFWFGAVVAIVGARARSKLKETPAFLKMNEQKLKAEVEALNLESDPDGAVFNKNWKEKVQKSTIASYLLVSAGTPLTYFLAFFYFNTFLKNRFGFTAEDIISHNFLLSFFVLGGTGILAFASNYIHPLRIMKFNGYIALFLMIILPFLLDHLTSTMPLFVIQTIMGAFALNDFSGGAGVMLTHLPVYKRFTYASFIFATSRAAMYLITSFGLTYLGMQLGDYGLWIITLPGAVGFIYGINHFIKLEEKFSLYPNLS